MERGFPPRTDTAIAPAVIFPGGVKRQDATPVPATAIFEQIDAMPMRQQEMQQRGRK